MKNEKMTLKELLMEEHSGPRCELIATLAIQNPSILEELIQLSFSDEGALSRRAAWPLRKVHDRQPELIKPFLGFFIDQLSDLKSESVLRTILSILSRSNIAEEYHGFMLSFCESKILNASTSIASVANCFDIYYNIAAYEPDLLRELDLMFDLFPPSSSAGIKSKIRIIRRKMHKKFDNASR
jgi:hypothetical protein